MKEVVDKLREYMSVYNLNQRQVSRRFGVHESTVSRWLSDEEMKPKHMNLIRFMLAGHDKQQQPFVCTITGRDKCAFDGATSIHRAILEIVLDMDEPQCLDALEMLVGQKKASTSRNAAKAGA